MTEIPVINLSAFSQSGNVAGKRKVASQIDVACRDIGFFLVTQHGVPDHIIQTAWDASKKYFALDLSLKRKILMDETYPYGYSGFAEETLANTQDNSKHTAPDQKESFCIGPCNQASGMPPRKWPEVEGFQKAWSEYYQAMENLSSKLLSAFALALNEDEDWFFGKTDHHASAMRALNYPVPKDEPSERQLGAGEHTDYGTLTILTTNGPGLQVRTRENCWIDVPVESKYLIVNIGDLMQMWTSDLWVSTLHRVAALRPNSAPRQSIAFFHNVNRDTVVKGISSCCRGIKYPPIKAGEYLDNKHKAATTSGY